MLRPTPLADHVANGDRVRQVLHQLRRVAGGEKVADDRSVERDRTRAMCVEHDELVLVSVEHLDTCLVQLALKLDGR